MIEKNMDAFANKLLFLSMLIILLLNLSVNLYAFYFGEIPIKWGYISLPIVYWAIMTVSINSIKSVRMKFNSLIAAMLVITVIGLQLISMLEFCDGGYRWELYKSTISSTIFSSVFMYLLGLNFDQAVMLFNNRRYKRLSILCLIIFIGLILFSTLRTYRLYDVFEIFSPGADDFSISYISYADNVAVIFIFLCIYSKNRALGVTWFLTGTFILSALLSRGALIVYVLAFLFYYLLRSVTSLRRLMFSILICLLFCLLFYFMLKSIRFADELVKNSRALSILHNIIELKSFSQLYRDDSYLGRSYILRYSLNDLKNIWFAGSFMHEIDLLGPGNYIHNWLSFWVCYGIIPFAVLIFIVVKTYIKNIAGYIGSNSPFIKFILIFGFFNLFHIMFDRTYYYYYMWFSIASMAMLADGGYHMTEPVAKETTDGKGNKGLLH